MEVCRTAHSVYRLQYHVVWVCKYRRRILNSGVCDYLRKVLPQLLRRMPGVEIKTIGFDQDHLHMIMVMPPRYSIADVMGQVKSQSSSHLRKTFGWLKKVYWNESIVWSPGYFVSSVAVDEETIKRYVNTKDARIQVNAEWSCNGKNPGFSRENLFNFTLWVTGRKDDGAL